MTLVAMVTYGTWWRTAEAASPGLPKTSTSYAVWQTYAGWTLAQFQMSQRFSTNNWFTMETKKTFWEFNTTL